MTPSDRAAPLLEALQVLDRSAMDLGAGGRQGRRLVVRTAEAAHLMTGRDQLLDDGRADESGGAGDKNAHKNFSFAWTG